MLTTYSIEGCCRAERTKDTDLILLTLAESCGSMQRIILAYAVLKSEPCFGGLVWLQLHTSEASFQIICAGIHRDKSLTAPHPSKRYQNLPQGLYFIYQNVHNEFYTAGLTPPTLLDKNLHFNFSFMFIDELSKCQIKKL